MVGVGGKRDAEDCREEGSRYDGITVVFGREFQQRLSESRVIGRGHVPAGIDHCDGYGSHRAEQPESSVFVPRE